MMKKTALSALFFMLTVAPCALFGQYYDLGQTPFSIRWNQIKSKHNQVIFPNTYERQAVRTMHYLDTIRPYISHGFRYGPMKIPLVIHTQNFASNGLVMWAPKRMEFISTPNINSFAEPWLKQLSSHEYRHAVQYNNLNRNFIRVLSYPLGQQGSLIGLALLPIWLIEGDATLAETQLSSFGRALQPSFTIEMRAYSGEPHKKFSRDKWFCGSYKDMMPDHYQVGYQIASWADNHYKENIWNKVASYGSKYPFFILTTKFSLHRYYRTSVNKLFDNTFTDLNNFWSSQPRLENTAQIINTPNTSFTTYSAPTPINDTTLIALKSDFDRYNRLVSVDTRTGAEHVISYIGQMSTPPTYNNGKIYWTEYRKSTFWDQRINSQLCMLDIAHGRPQIVRKQRRVLYPTPTNNGDLAMVEYNYNGSYSIKDNLSSITLPDTISVHGLTFDNTTARLYFIGLSDSGMWIGTIKDDFSSFKIMTSPAYITLNNLRAQAGKLYYNSIKSGRDEAHIYDIANSSEYMATTSTYGSFSPMPTLDNSSIVLTTYSNKGYLLSQQKIKQSTLKELENSKLPQNIVNPPRREWKTINIDSVTVSSTTELPVKRYKKGLHGINVHSWAPVSFDPDKIVDEQYFNLYAGATLISQNVLGSMVTHLNYGYLDGGSRVRANIKYYGFAPKIEIDAQYGGGRQIVYGMTEDAPIPTCRKQYFDITTRIFLPSLLAGGYHIKYLTPMVEFTHYNALRYNGKGGFDKGMQKLSATLQYTDNVRLAYRDFLPRWGYALKIGSASNPFNSEFSTLWSGYARVYMPGFALHHSITIRTSAQYQHLNRYAFAQKELFPRGADYNFAPNKYASASFDYQLPICYPDGGIGSILYFKRIRANVGVDYARYRDVRHQNGEIYSYGADIYFDINAIRMPASANTTVKISIYKPSNRSGCVVGFDLSLPI